MSAMREMARYPSVFWLALSRLRASQRTQPVPGRPNPGSGAQAPAGHSTGTAGAFAIWIIYPESSLANHYSTIDKFGQPLHNQ